MRAGRIGRSPPKPQTPPPPNARPPAFLTPNASIKQPQEHGAAACEVAEKGSRREVRRQEAQEKKAEAEKLWEEAAARKQAASPKPRAPSPRPPRPPESPLMTASQLLKVTPTDSRGPMADSVSPQNAGNCLALTSFPVLQADTATTTLDVHAALENNHAKHGSLNEQAAAEPDDRRERKSVFFDVNSQKKKEVCSSAHISDTALMIVPTVSTPEPILAVVARGSG